MTINAPTPVADLGVRLPGATLAPKIGHLIRLGVVVFDDGPSAETSTALSLTLPVNTRLVSAVPRQGSCAGHPTTCNLRIAHSKHNRTSSS